MARPKKIKEPTPPRGFGTGRRGPSKTWQEKEAGKVQVERVIMVEPEPREVSPKVVAAITEYNQKVKAGVVEKPPRGLSATRKANNDLQRYIREIGEEVIDPQSGWTRIGAVIRRLYADALQGKTQAADLLFERGWGKAVQPVQLDVEAEARQLIISMGLSRADIESDPVLRELLTVEGTLIDLEPSAVSAPIERVAERTSEVELVRSEPVPDGSNNQLLRPEPVVEDGGRD